MLFIILGYLVSYSATTLWLPLELVCNTFTIQFSVERDGVVDRMINFCKVLSNFCQAKGDDAVLLLGR